MKVTRSSRGRTCRRYSIALIPLTILVALVFRSELASSLQLRARQLAEVEDVRHRVDEGESSLGVRTNDVLINETDDFGDQAAPEEEHLTTIRSPVEPEVEEGAQQENIWDQGSLGKSPPPPPFARPLRPPPESRPFSDVQEDRLDEVLNELKGCTSLRCIIRSHGRIDGRTPFKFPHFFLIGFPYSGGHHILKFLNKHSEFDGTIRINGSSWFNYCQTEDGPDVRQDGCNAKSEADYIQNYLHAKKAASRELEMLTVDTSVDYLQAGGPLARRLYRYFPWLKIVIVVRDPISRVIAKLVRRLKDGRLVYDGCPEHKQLFSCLQDVMAPGSIDSNYSEPLLGWLQTFPSRQIHAIQYEELIQAPDKVLFDLKYFLGANVAELDGEFSMDGIETAVTEIRRGQYMRLMREIQEDAEKTLYLLYQYGLAPKKSWLSRWEANWQSVLSSCRQGDQCSVVTEVNMYDSN